MSARSRRGMSITRTVLLAASKAVDLVFQGECREATLVISGCRMAINIDAPQGMLRASTPDTFNEPPSKPLFSARVARDKDEELLERIVAFVKSELGQATKVEIRLISRYADGRNAPVLYVDNATRCSFMRQQPEHFPV